MTDCVWVCEDPNFVFEPVEKRRSQPWFASMNALRFGSWGRNVEAVQRSLGIPANGFFGRDTEEAVKMFQRSHFLLPNGVVGPATWQAIFSKELQI